MKRFFALALILSLLLTGCAAGQGTGKSQQFTATFLDVFDTVTSVKGSAESEAVFTSIAQGIHDDLLHYHQLFDIYHDYEGIHNLKTINDNAGIAPVQVDGVIIDLLTDCKEFYTLTKERVNVAMGSVLKIWHEAREDGFNDPANAYLPDQVELEKAAAFMDLDAVVIDAAASTVYITDPQVQLDVGAIAKGWATQRVAESLPEGILISVGGNTCATGPKDESGTQWVIGVQNPDGGDDYLHTLYLTKGSIVTSGDYQSNYDVNGQLYHHIIDPDTLYPSTYWRSVTIVCENSGLADALSTALFLLTQEEGQKLLDITGAKAMWVDQQGEIFYSPGFETLIRS